jgi:photosystem II stability/assembly factor-like uncharacterized protein
MNSFNKISFLLLFSLFFTVLHLQAQDWVSVFQDSTTNWDQKSATFQTYWNGKTIEKGKGFKQFKRIEYFTKTRLNEQKKFNPTVNRLADYKQLQDLSNSSAKSFGSAGNWVQLGPFGPAIGSGSGRINCISFHPTDANVILIGAPAGGIWRTEDGGSSWHTNTDDLAAIGISDICFAPSNGNIVYAASGDKDASDTYSVGILKSIDGGMTWDTTGWQQKYYSQRQTYRILVHPTNADIVFACTSLGLYKTIDGGVTWTRKRVGAYRDIEFMPGNPNVIYIASSSAVAKSVNMGESFTNLNISFAYSVERLEIAVTAADTNYIYVLASKSSDHGFGGLYQSIDGGTTFTTKSTTPNILGWQVSGSDSGGQGWYDLSLDASPSNKNIIYTGGVNLWKSVDGGLSWDCSGHWTGSGGTPYVHADIHMIKHSPHSTSKVWACTDGGVSFTSNNGTQWTEKNTNLSVAQMYRLGASKTNANLIITGWQDNGSNLMSTSWEKVLGGDGMECIINHTNNSIMYGSLYYGAIRRSLDGGNNWSGITDDITETGNWVTPFVLDPNNSSTLYAGFENVWKSTDNGNSWNKISNFYNTTGLNVVAVAPSNSQTLWVSDDNHLYKTTNGGTSWANITRPNSYGQITSIAINLLTENILWLSISGFYASEKVFQSLDGGSTWTNITGSLPNYPANTIVNDPASAHGLYLGTDLGVYYRDSVLGDWVPFSKNLPNVVISELELFSQGQKIRAATYGRGLWESVTYGLANATNNPNLDNLNQLNIYPNPAENTVNIVLYNSELGKAELQIFNAIGQMIESRHFNNNTVNKIDISQFEKGIYLVQIKTETQLIENKFIVK